MKIKIDDMENIPYNLEINYNKKLEIQNKFSQLNHLINIKYWYKKNLFKIKILALPDPTLNTSKNFEG